MERDCERFASDGVFTPEPRSTGQPCLAQPRAEVIERLVNPRGLGVAPARLVATIDAAIQSALDESPLVLWETEEVVRFELPDARILLALSEGDTPGEGGLTLGVVFEGENCTEIAWALGRLIARSISLRYPSFEPLPRDGAFAHDALIDVEIGALLALPLSGALPGLPPVEMLVDQVWKRAAACTSPPRKAQRLQLPAPLQLSFWQRALGHLHLPQIAPMRQSVRVLALMLFAMGLMQGPTGQQAQAETQAQP